MQPKMNAKEIFLKASEIESFDERIAYVASVCAGDTSLRRQVEALLAANDNPDSFLDRPPIDFEGLATLAHDRASSADATSIEEAGSTFGNYKLLQEIGQGGFGVVYMAEQEQPVRRQVALKIIKPGMDTREVIARFEAERQALALMDHPNIAKVFDAGATSSGRPYFVMELVKGVPITEFCDKNKFTTRKRLELFVAVCNAVQHAHQKGVIHRDLKPSNVMITLHDGKPVPKVIDFGISKAISQRLTEKTLFTRYGQMIGTPQYMSPEQAEMSGLDVDTRSDVYSLGVLLYELLTGTTPLQSDSLRDAGYAELLRMIQEDEAPKPSTRLSTLADRLTVICQERSTNERQLSKLVRGELDWIVMKTLEKDRSRRYESASSLAADVERYLNEEPVLAGAPSRLHRFKRTLRRHRVSFAVAGAVFASLLTGTVLATYGLVQADAARTEAIDSAGVARAAQRTAEDERRLAQQQAERSSRIVETLKQLLETADPTSGSREDYTVRQMLDDFVGSIHETLAGDPAVEYEVRSTISDVYENLGRTADAVEQASRASAAAKLAYGETSVEYAGSLMKQVMPAVQHQLNEGVPWGLHASKDGVVANIDQAIAIFRTKPECRIDLGRALEQKAYYSESVLGDGKAAYSLLREAVELLTERSQAVDGSVLYKPLHFTAGHVLRSLATYMNSDPDKQAEAYSLAKQAVDILREYDSPDLVWALRDLAGIELRLDHPDIAEKLLVEAKSLTSPTAYTDRDMGLLFATFGPLNRQFRYADSISACDSDIAKIKALGQQDSAASSLRFAHVLVAKGIVCYGRGDFLNATKFLRNAIHELKSEPLVSPWRLHAKFRLAEALVERNDTYEEGQQLLRELALLAPVLSLRRDDDLIRHILVCLAADLDMAPQALIGQGLVIGSELAVQDSGSAWEKFLNVIKYAKLLHRVGRSDEALTTLDDVITTVFPSKFMELLLATNLKAKILRDLNIGEAEVEQAHRNLVTIWREACPQGHPIVSVAESQLARYLISQKRLAESEEILKSAQERLLAEHPQRAPFHLLFVYEVELELAKAKHDETKLADYESRIMALKADMTTENITAEKTSN